MLYRVSVLLCVLGLSACDDGGGSTSAGDAEPAVDAALPDVPDAEREPDAAPPQPPDPSCDPLDPSACAYPWPSSHFLAPDARSQTGYRLAFTATTLPANRQGVRVDPAPYQRLDGYGVGSMLLTRWPHLDAAPLPDENAIAESIEPSAHILWFEDTGEGLERVPWFAELDRRERDPEQQTLIVRPAVILKEATRYVVAFRGLVDAEGVAFAPSEAFAELRAGASADPRQPRFDRLFADLEAEGVDPGELQLAWDFVTASCASTHGRMLSMRDQALAIVGTRGPEITVEEVRESTREEREHIALEIDGTVRVPHFMRETEPYLGLTGWVFNLDDGGAPAQDGWREAPFTLIVPHSALTGRPHGMVNHGHGLNGTLDQVRAGPNREVADTHDLVFFGWNMVGMSSEDVPGILTMLTDLSFYPWLADRLHQGLLDGLVLARAMKGRLATLPELVERGVVIDPERLYYSGHSQGGIYGASYLALSTDTTRGLLGVPGQNYSTLLERSVDFDPFLLGINGSYPDRADQLTLLATVALLWEGTDPVSYYRHLSAEPFPDTPVHHVIAAPAKGDWQVAPLTMEIVARSELGVPLMDNYADDREVDLVEPRAYPHEGSGIVNWHMGGSWPPPGNITPPRDEAGDPHGRPRRHPDHNRQMVHFFRTGEIIDVCEDGLCPAE